MKEFQLKGCGLIMCVDLEKHELLKARLRIAGSSLSAVARELSVSHSSVTVVSQGYRKSLRIQAALAAKIKKNASDIWPERYKEK
ncbi:MAG: helix-turn-helix domain-containing protein [Nereida ignava]